MNLKKMKNVIMKTIEDKINEIVEGHAECRWLDAGELQEYLEEVATEQKAIDDAERDTAVYNLLMLKLDAEKKLWLDKACEWMKINYGHFDGSIEDLVADFRKAMEE